MLIESKKYIIGKDTNADLSYLLVRCKKRLGKFDKNLIKSAFNLCIQAHEGKVRKSGEPFYTHSLQVAIIVIDEIPLDDISVASALLHDVLNYSEKYKLDDIRKQFGPTVAEIVTGVHKIKNIESYNIDQLNQLENYRKLLLSLFTDVRIILIKLADRLHNMRTLEYLPVDRQIYLANETLEVYAPFANRFGLRNLKWELEDLAFKYTYRKEYDSIKSSLRGTRKEREEYVDRFTAPIKEKLEKDRFLRKNRIKFEISGRAKHIFSIYNKMRARQKAVGELYDLVAVRIIINSNDDNMCFYVYGLIAAIYPPVFETFKDYINAPKKNGYQSIHVAVVGPDKKPVEIQIRTERMHRISEHGFASHFGYKRGLLPAQSVLDDKNIQEWMDTVRVIFENTSEETPQQLLESVKKNLFMDEIHVFTPANELRAFPRDATPLDFAFSIHSEIGYQCIGAKVNGKIVPLDYKLHNGDQVEILTSANQKPSKQWLRIVATSRAKTLISKYIRDDQKKVEEIGRNIWLKNLEKHNLKIDQDDLSKLAKSLNYKDIPEFFVALGSHKFDIGRANDYFKYMLNDGFDRTKFEPGNKPAKSKLTSKISIAECCCPLKDDKITGLITDSNVLTIHRSECPRVKKEIESNHSKQINVDWNDISIKEFKSHIHVTASEHPDFVGELTGAIVGCEGITLEGMDLDSNAGRTDSDIVVVLKSLSHYKLLADRISKVKSFESIKRIIE